MMRRMVFIVLFLVSAFGRTDGLIIGGAGSCAASDNLYETRLDEGLSNTEPYSYLLITKALAERGERRELLNLAKKYSPDLPAVYFELAGESFSPSANGIFESVDYFRQGLEAYGRNFWWAFSFAGIFSASLMVSFFLSLLGVVAIRFPVEYRLISHDIHEDRTKLIFLVALVVLALLGVVPFIAGVLFLLGLYFRGKDKSLVCAAFLALLVSPLMVRTADIFLSPPSPELRAIVAVNEGKDNRYALMNLKPTGEFAEAFSRALALKREGYYEQAITLYKTLIGRHGDPLVYINLGNAFYALKDLDAATRFYKMSIGIKPLPAAFFNLSQVHRDLFDFSKGEEYFLEAAKLDSEAASRFAAISGRSPNRSVIDETLPISAIWEYAKGKGGISSLPFILGAVMMTAFYLCNKKIKVRAHQCKRCGAIFCSKCSRTLAWGDMCPQCYNFLMKMEQMDSRERIERLLSTYQNQTKRRRKIKLLSTVIPGAGQVFAGRLVAGFFFLWLFFFSLSLITISRFPFAGISPFTHGWLITLAIVLLSFAYISSILYMREGMRKGWL
ncbi:MAG TPA: hypothetical protein VEI96_06695 [Thermodesulfovibrionales bacterium]|nr:hypothetical protein [Thermodesulfovibrionales bacterium]